MKRIVVLVSGRGSNMTALADRCAAEGWPARIAGVVSSRPGAAALDAAAARGIATAIVDARAYADRRDFDAALAEAVERFEPDLVVLAGFMRILGESFVARFEGRMLNVHPSLLPSFTGLHTHQRAIDAGCTVAGATVHFVTAELDHGPIVAQAVVPLKPGDDADALAARVLAVEHVMLPLAVRWFVDGRLRIEGQRVRQLDGAAQQILAGGL
jgi:phosphoribosylglycinamide formyltransferase-1